MQGSWRSYGRRPRSRLEPEKGDHIRYLELLPQTREVYKVRHMRFLYEQLAFHTMYQMRYYASPTGYSFSICLKTHCFIASKSSMIVCTSRRMSSAKASASSAHAPGCTSTPYRNICISVLVLALRSCVIMTCTRVRRRDFTVCSFAASKCSVLAVVPIMCVLWIAPRSMVLHLQKIETWVADPLIAVGECVTGMRKRAAKGVERRIGFAK